MITDETMARAWFAQWHQFTDPAGRTAFEVQLWRDGSSGAKRALEMIEVAKLRGSARRLVAAVVVVAAVAFATLGHAAPAWQCACPELLEAIEKSRKHAAWDASWHYLNPAQQEYDWERGRRWRGYLVAELYTCKRHAHLHGKVGR